MAGRRDVIMPKVGMYLEDMLLVEWHRDEGSRVAPGDVLFTFETDKVTSDVEAEDAGILHRLVEAGASVPIGTLVGVLVATDEEYAALAGGGPASASASAEEPPAAQSELFLNYVRESDEPIVVPPPGPAQAPRPAPRSGRRLISPRARAYIAEMGLTPEVVDRIPATGPDGRLTDKDVRAYLQAVAAQPPASAAPGEVTVAGSIPLKGRRRVIARRMLESLHGSAQLTSILEVDVAPVVAWRERSEPRLSYTTIFVSIAAAALRRHALVNARMGEGEIELLGDVNVGFAVNTEDGVVVPVVHGADRPGLVELDSRVRDLTARARAGTLAIADVEGGTFTLSNSGNAPVDITTAILNPPQAAILWLGRIRERPVAIDGMLGIRPTMQACLTYDHRILDGVPAAEFLGTFAALAGAFGADA